MIPHHTVDGPDDAEPVVFANSLGTTLAMWRPQVEAFNDRFRLVRHDTRGHGRSPIGRPGFGIDDLADDIRDLLDHLHLERAHLVGVSLGGATAAAFAARHPDRTARLALICTAARIGTPAYWTQRQQQVRRAGMPWLAEGAMGRWFTDRFREDRPETVERFRDEFARCDPTGYTACCAAISAMDLHPKLGKIAAPTLVAYADLDEVVTAADAEALQAGIPDARLAEIKGAKHLAPTERAAMVNGLLLEHFEP
jgi:3-oxoadipate enol-lactonase